MTESILSRYITEGDKLDLQKKVLFVAGVAVAECFAGCDNLDSKFPIRDLKQRVREIAGFSMSSSIDSLVDAKLVVPERKIIMLGNSYYIIFKMPEEAKARFIGGMLARKCLQLPQEEAAYFESQKYLENCGEALSPAERIYRDNYF